MELDELLERATDTMNVRRVFGEPVERGSVLIIPVAVVMGGGGGGAEEKPGGSGRSSGGGFGTWSRPIGVYVVRGDRVEFRPAVDLLPLLVVGSFLLRRLLRAFTADRR
jgi:uncharacterized spore protein YtfJ